jgi:hypothetical protein
LLDLVIFNFAVSFAQSCKSFPSQTVSILVFRKPKHTTTMPNQHLQSSTFLSIPLELRNIIHLYIAQIYVLNVSTRDRKIQIADDSIENTCCAMHSRRPISTFASLSLVSHQIAAEAHQVAFHRTRSPITVYFSTACTVSDFECHNALYQPSPLRDFVLHSTQDLRVKAPPAWQALPLPGACFRALEEFEVTGVTANVHDTGVLRMSLRWEGWEKEEGLSDERKWVFKRIK